MKEDKPVSDKTGMNINQEKILLVLFPFWTPLIPPMGISCLKGYLQKYGYNVKTVDANLDIGIKQLYDDYFAFLEEIIPGNKKSNFYNIGQEVLRNHMLAYVNFKEEQEYLDLVKELIYKTFYVHYDHRKISRLSQLVFEIFTRLEGYISDLLEKEKPAIMGASVYKGTIASTLFALRLTREKYPYIKTVIGGGAFSDQLASGSSNLELFLEKTKDYIDKIIIGEGEELFLKLLKGQLPNWKKVYTQEDVDNKVLDISSLGNPDFRDFNLEYYPYMGAYGGRGCPFNCAFCSETVLWGKYRKKKIKTLVEEIQELKKIYGSQLFLMTDSLLNPFIDDFSKELIKAGESIYWDGYLRVDKHACDTEKSLLWRKGGYYRCRLGIESGSQRVLELMNKKITVEQIKQAVSSLAYAGIKTTTYWVIGYPGETEQDFQQTLDLIQELRNKIYEADCNPFNYYRTGQARSDQWQKEDKSIAVYSEDARNMLMVPTWAMDCEPSREETYKRMNRFVQHCSSLGIPNPYCLNDIYKADLRWKKLHKNAVPSLLDFNTNNYIDENKQVTKLSFIQARVVEEGDFGF